MTMRLPEGRRRLDRRVRISPIFTWKTGVRQIVRIVLSSPLEWVRTRQPERFTRPERRTDIWVRSCHIERISVKDQRIVGRQ